MSVWHLLKSLPFLLSRLVEFIRWADQTWTEAKNKRAQAKYREADQLAQDSKDTSQLEKRFQDPHR